MAKICPETNKAVIYLTCADCENKIKCREESKKNYIKNKKETNIHGNNNRA